MKYIKLIMVFKIIKRIFRIIIVILNINWFKVIKYYDKNAKTVIWITFNSLRYFNSDTFIWDCATLNAVATGNINFKIFFGYKIGKLSDKIILHTLSKSVNIFDIPNLIKLYSMLLPELEKMGNHLFPNSYEAMFWENKGFMHEHFKKLNISEPKTDLFVLKGYKVENDNVYPFLIKSEHSCSSQGVYKINSKIDFENVINNSKFRLENDFIIKQELINMRKDLRVILVGDEIVHFYWRINTKDVWMPTATSFGSKVDFVYFPEYWRNHIIQTFKSLKLVTGAFDITWQNDDLSSEPLYLEISPVYQPNPKIELKNNRHYYQYKNSLLPFNKFDREYVKLIFSIKNKQINCLQGSSFFNQ